MQLGHRGVSTPLTPCRPQHSRARPCATPGRVAACDGMTGPEQRSREAEWGAFVLRVWIRPRMPKVLLPALRHAPSGGNAIGSRAHGGLLGTRGRRRAAAREGRRPGGDRALQLGHPGVSSPLTPCGALAGRRPLHRGRPLGAAAHGEGCKHGRELMGSGDAMRLGGLMGSGDLMATPCGPATPWAPATPCDPATSWSPATPCDPAVSWAPTTSWVLRPHATRRPRWFRRPRGLRRPHAARRPHGLRRPHQLLRPMRPGGLMGSGDSMGSGDPVQYVGSGDPSQRSTATGAQAVPWVCATAPHAGDCSMAIPNDIGRRGGPGGAGRSCRWVGGFGMFEGQKTAVSR